MKDETKKELDALSRQMMRVGRELFNETHVNEFGEQRLFLQHGRELMNASAMIQSWLKEAKA